MTQIILREARISFPKLWVAEPFETGGEPRYSAVFLVEEGGDNYKAINAAIKQAATDKWGAKAPAKLKGVEGIPNKYCFMDGERKPDLAGYPGNWALSAVRKEKDGRPMIVDRSKQPISASDGIIYAGCYVNATVDIWAQDGQYQGIRCTLVNVQFVKKGESFGGSTPATTDGLDDLGYDEDEDLM